MGQAPPCQLSIADLLARREAATETLYNGLAEISRARDVQTVLQLIAEFVQAAGWQRVTASLRESGTFRVTHLASAGLTTDEHEQLLNHARGGEVWYERLGPRFERFHQDDWYYLPASDPDVQAMHLEGVASTLETVPGAGWHRDDMLYLPLRRHDEEPIGLVVIDDPVDQTAPTVEQMRPVQLFVRNAALILENLRLHRESERRLAATRVVQQTAALVAGSLGPGTIIQQVIDQLVQDFDYPMIVVYLRHGDHFVTAGQSGYGDSADLELINRQQGVTGRAVRQRAMQWVADVSRDPDYVEGNPSVTSEIAVPLVRGVEVVGLINVEGTRDRPLLAEDRELLGAISEQLTTAINNSRLFDEIQRYALQLETAGEVSRRVTSILNIDQLLREVVDLIQRNFDYYHVQLYLHDSVSGGWLLREGAGVAFEQLKEQHAVLQPNQGIVGEAGATGMAVLAPDVRQHSGYLANPLLPGTRAELAVPLRLGAQILGVLDVQSDVEHGLTDHDRAILETLANQIVVALNNAQLFSEIDSELDLRERLYRASFGISNAQDGNEILLAIMDQLAGPDMARAGLLAPVVRLFHDSRYPELLDVAAIWNPSRDPLLIQPGTRLLAAKMPSLRKLATNQVQLVDDIETDERLDPWTRMVTQKLGVRSLALVPLRAGRRVMGWLLLMSRRRAGFDERRLKPFQALADQAALALERVRLLAQTQERAARLAAVNTLAANITSTLELQQTLDDSVSAMAQLFGVRQSGLLMFEENNTRGRLVAQYREDGYRHEREIIVPLTGNPMTDRLLSSRAPVYITDIENDPLAITIRQGTHPRSYTAILAVPLLTRDRVIGSISLDVVAGYERSFEPEEIELAQTMAAQIAAAIENARLFEEATTRAYDMETTSQVGQQLTRLLDEEEIVREVVRHIADRFGFYHVGLYMRDDEHANRLVLREGTGEIGETLRRRRHIVWGGQGLPGHVLQSSDPAVANRVSEDSRYARQPLLAATQSQAALPLSVGGILLGVLDLHSDRPDVFQPDKLWVLSTIADQLAIALQNARFFAAQEETVVQLQQLDRLKSEFLASMSHELRTPLNSIIGFSKIMLRGIDGPVTDLQKQDLTSIFNSGQHLLSLINDILDLSKIAAGKMELQRETLDLNAVVEDVLLSVGPQAAERSLRLENQLGTELPLVHADRTRVRQVLLNLLANAVKFTDSGGVFVTARRVGANRPPTGTRVCPADPVGAYLELSVRDTGAGIRFEDQELVFEEFRQADGSNSRRAGGTGLGLAIARRFTELHGGALWVESRVGVGSTFRFTLPLPENILVQDTARESAEPSGIG